MENNGSIELTTMQAAKLNSKVISFPFRLIPEEEILAEAKAKGLIGGKRRVSQSLTIPQNSLSEPALSTQNVAIDRPKAIFPSSYEEQFMNIANMVDKNVMIQTNPRAKEMINKLKEGIAYNKISMPLNFGVRIEEILVEVLNTFEDTSPYTQDFLAFKQQINNKVKEIIQREEFILPNEDMMKVEEFLTKFEKRKKKKDNVEGV